MFYKSTIVLTTIPLDFPSYSECLIELGKKIDEICNSNMGGVVIEFTSKTNKDRMSKEEWEKYTRVNSNGSVVVEKIVVVLQQNGLTRHHLI